MQRILKLLNVQHLRSANPKDTASSQHDGTHVYLYFAEYVVKDNGCWEEGGAWVSTVSVEELLDVLYEAEHIKEIAPSKQSGGK